MIVCFLDNTIYLGKAQEIITIGKNRTYTWYSSQTAAFGGISPRKSFQELIQESKELKAIKEGVPLGANNPLELNPTRRLLLDIPRIPLNIAIYNLSIFPFPFKSISVEPAEFRETAQVLEKFLLGNPAFPNSKIIIFRLYYQKEQIQSLSLFFHDYEQSLLLI